MEYSVLMSVYHKEKAGHLKESITSMLGQTICTNDFVIVCDGELTAELDKIISSYSEKSGEIFNIVRLPKNVGLGQALNEGLAHCKNEIVARMDSDDISMPGRCELQLAKMSELDLDIISGTVKEFDGDISQTFSTRILPETHEEILKFARKRNAFNHPCVMFKKSSVESAGGYKPFHLCEDYYLWVRMLQNGARGYNIQQPVLYMRAGDAMYKRRAGFKYLKSMVKFRWYMKRSGFSGWGDFFISSGGLTLTALSPQKIRRYIYNKKLRNN